MGRLQNEINSLRRIKEFKQLKTMIQSKDENDVKLAIEIIKSKKKYPTISRNLQQEYNWEKEHGSNWHSEQGNFLMYEVDIDMDCIDDKSRSIYANCYCKVQRLFRR